MTPSATSVTGDPWFGRSRVSCRQADIRTCNTKVACGHHTRGRGRLPRRARRTGAVRRRHGGRGACPRTSSASVPLCARSRARPAHGRRRDPGGGDDRNVRASSVRRPGPADHGMGLRHRRQQAPGATPVGITTSGDLRGRRRRAAPGRHVRARARRRAARHRAAGGGAAGDVAGAAGRDPAPAGGRRPVGRGDCGRARHDTGRRTRRAAPRTGSAARLSHPGRAAMTTHQFDDFAAIAADDALLDALGAGDFDVLDTDLNDTHLDVSDDAMAALLTQWRRELDTAVPASPARGTAAVVPAVRSASDGSVHAEAAPSPSVPHSSWLRRHVVGVAAASVVVLGGSTGIAAADTSHSGPFAAVHRVLVGSPGPNDTATIVRVDALLDSLTIDLGNARAHGGATAAQTADMSSRLAHAGRLLAVHPAAPDALTARLVELRADLAALDTVPTSPPGVGNDNGGQSARFPDETGSHGPGSGSVTDGDHDGDDAVTSGPGGAQTAGTGDGGGATTGGSGTDGGGSATD